MTFEPPTGLRRVRVLRTTHHSVPVTHPTNPTLDSWNSYDDVKVMWVFDAHVDPRMDKRLDL